jgi:hypothetical protein
MSPRLHAIQSFHADVEAALNNCIMKAGSEVQQVCALQALKLVTNIMLRCDGNRLLTQCHQCRCIVVNGKGLLQTVLRLSMFLNMEINASLLVTSEAN